MKKLIIPLLLGAFMLASCEKDPDFSKLDEDFVVLTKYDKTYNFKDNAKTFYISDTITLISDDATNPAWCNSTSQQIIDQIKNQFISYGYTFQAPDPANPDAFTAQYLISVVAFKDAQTVIYSYNWDPYWFDYYDWYGWYWWWDGYAPYYPYYPYVYGYEYNVGTTLIEMVDMQTTDSQGHPIRWNAILGGMLNTGNDMLYEQDAISQAFQDSQSYLKVN